MLVHRVNDGCLSGGCGCGLRIAGDIWRATVEASVRLAAVGKLWPGLSALGCENPRCSVSAMHDDRVGT